MIGFFTVLHSWIKAKIKISNYNRKINFYKRLSNTRLGRLWLMSKFIGK